MLDSDRQRDEASRTRSGSNEPNIREVTGAGAFPAQFECRRASRTTTRAVSKCPRTRTHGMDKPLDPAHGGLN
jgi:hypothetical protein